MAELLKTKGYQTGCVGKWHLGHHLPYLPLQNGFDEYFGIPYSNDMAGQVYMRGNDVVEQQPDQHFLTSTYTKEAVSFIERNAETPFFLYLAHNMPHVPLYASPDFEGRSGNGIYADVVEELDESVGQIINKIKELKLEKNTIIVFSSDNGPWLAMRELGGSAGGLREGKQFTFDGGMKVPCLVYAPGRVQAGKVMTAPASMMDWMPTFASLAGINIPDSLDFDGMDISSQLVGNAASTDRALIYFANGKAEAFRQGDMKIKMPYKGNEANWWKTAVPAHDTLLFNLKNDPSEKINLWPTASGVTKASILLGFKNSLNELGTLPPPMATRYDADESHVEILKSK
jgi:arylsulfatase